MEIELTNLKATPVDMSIDAAGVSQWRMWIRRNYNFKTVFSLMYCLYILATVFNDYTEYTTCTLFVCSQSSLLEGVQYSDIFLLQDGSCGDCPKDNSAYSYQQGVYGCNACSDDGTYITSLCFSSVCSSRKTVFAMTVVKTFLSALNSLFLGSSNLNRLTAHLTANRFLNLLSFIIILTIDPRDLYFVDLQWILLVESVAEILWDKFVLVVNDMDMNIFGYKIDYDNYY